MPVRPAGVNKHKIKGGSIELGTNSVLHRCALFVRNPFCRNDPDRKENSTSWEAIHSITGPRESEGLLRTPAS